MTAWMCEVRETEESKRESKVYGLGVSVVRRAIYQDKGRKGKGVGVVKKGEYEF